MAVLSFRYLEDGSALAVSPADPRRVIPSIAERRLLRRDLAREAQAAVKLTEVGFRRCMEPWNGEGSAAVGYEIARTGLRASRGDPAGPGMAGGSRGETVSAGGPLRSVGDQRRGLVRSRREGRLRRRCRGAARAAARPAPRRRVRHARRRQHGHAARGLAEEVRAAGRRWARPRASASALPAPARRGCSTPCWPRSRRSQSTRASPKAREGLRGVPGGRARAGARGLRGRAARLPARRAGLAARSCASFGFGGCLADDMGLGKTVQVLAMLEPARARAGAQAARSVAGRGAPVAGLQLEAGGRALHARAARPRPHSGPSGRRRGRASTRSHDLTCSDHLRHPAPRHRVPEGASTSTTSFSTRPRRSRTPASESAKAARLLRGEHRLALRGTPVENHLGELWSLFEFLNPGMLGRAARSLARRARAPEPRDARRMLGPGPAALHPAPHQGAGGARAARRSTSRRSTASWSRSSARLYDELRDHYRAALLAPHRERGPRQGEDPGAGGAAAPAPGRLPPRADRQGRGGEPSAKLDVLLAQLRRGARRGPQGAGVLAVHQLPGDRARPPRRAPRCRTSISTARRATARRAWTRFQNDADCPLFLHQPEGRRPGPEPDRGRLRVPPRPLVEPGGRGAGHRPRPPHRPDQARCSPTG